MTLADFCGFFAGIWTFRTVYYILEATVKTQLGTLGQSLPPSVVYARHALDVLFKAIMSTSIVGILVTQTALYVAVLYLLMAFLMVALAAALAVGVYIVCNRMKQTCPCVELRASNLVLTPCASHIWGGLQLLCSRLAFDDAN